MICLAVLLSSCTRIIQVPVDERLTRDCDIPEMYGETWRDLAEAYIDRGQALRDCNDRMNAIRRD